ncbi:MAG: hypothetical protein Q8Q29_00590 [Actinomycetota bacterium]|nr:hypothetical protein [Actinomycetota bacterium]
MTDDARPLGQPTLDRRIERLEREFAAFDKDVALMKAELGHQRELMTAEFGKNGTAIARIEGVLGGLQASLTAAVQSITTASTDPAASPLGRALTTDIGDVDKKADRALAIAERVDRKLLLFTGAIGVLAWLGGFAGPVVARLVFGQ